MEGGEEKVALPYMLRLVALVPDDPDFLLQLAAIQSFNKQKDEALKTIGDAEKLARQLRDRELQNHIRFVRQQIENPMSGGLGGFLGGLPDFDEF